MARQESMTILEFQQKFGTEEACEEHLRGQARLLDALFEQAAKRGLQHCMGNQP